MDYCTKVNVACIKKAGGEIEDGIIRIFKGIKNKEKRERIFLAGVHHSRYAGGSSAILLSVNG